MEKEKENVIKKQVVINLDDITIGMKATQITNKDGIQKVVISINGRNYWGNYNFKLPIHIAAELIRILEEQQEEAIEKLTSQKQKEDKEDKEGKE